MLQTLIRLHWFMWTGVAKWVMRDFQQCRLYNFSFRRMWKTLIDRPDNQSFRCFVHIISCPYECAETPIRNGLCNIKLYQQTCSTSSNLSHTTSYKCSPDSLPVRDVQRTKLLSHTHTNTPNRALRRKYHSLSQALPTRLENKIAVPPS